MALLALPTAAVADGWRGGYGHSRHGYSSSIHLSSGGDVAIGILLGGLAVALVTQPYRTSGHGYRGDYRYSSYGYRRGYRYPSYGYGHRYPGYGYRRDYRYPSYGHRRQYQPTYAPPPRYVQHRNCSPIQGNGTYHGRPARFGGTHCYDGYGNGYVVPGSETFIYYLR